MVPKCNNDETNPPFSQLIHRKCVPHLRASMSIRVLKTKERTQDASSYMMSSIVKSLVLLALPFALLAADQLPSQAVSLLKRNCLACHGLALKASNLDLRTRDAILAGGERGPAVIPGYPERSFLYNFTSHRFNPAMPPDKKLPDAELDILRRWILAGIPWPADALPANEAEALAAKAATLKAMEERPVTAQERNFWSFRPVVRAGVPANGEAHPVDAFLMARWQENSLTPSPEASRRALARRAYLDLTGLPPTPDQLARFLNNNSPDAWPRLIDELLASPQYGERWARHWLDLVRYADSSGFEFDLDRPNAWRYRDYVVRAFNHDKPYDRFVLEQIAGDELDQPTTDSLIATGFLRLGVENNVKTEMTRLDELDDVVATNSLAFLGMTVGCARCHNHKFDPIPQKDYYQIQAVFFSAKNAELPLVSADEVERHKAENKRIDDLQAPHRKRKTAIEMPHRDQIFEEKINQLAPYMQLAWRTPPEKRTEGQRLNARQIERTLEIKDEEILARMSEEEKRAQRVEVEAIRKLDRLRPGPYPAANIIGEHSRDPLPSYFLHRGAAGNKGSLMGPGVLTAATWDGFQPLAPPEGAASSFRRRSFAEWVTDPRNPLTARVMVNRIWQHHFGQGIVASPSNFGSTGAPPTHPELLDWLASEFVRNGWSIKTMHRLMMTSRAYRMASDDIMANLSTDPANRFLWRAPRRRLDAEAIRDSILSIAGTLDLTTSGPAVLPYIDPDLFQSSSKRTWNGKPDTDPSTWRRSLYVFSKRTIRYPMFESFDQPDLITSCSRRNSSTTAPQALLLMNNAMVRLHAGKFAERLRREAGDEPAAQVLRAFTLALARSPSPAELSDSVAYVKSHPQGLADFCHAIFNLNEFVYMP
ncbi:MAG: DUF1553 domain-containing protein [Acidimicrobiia bacterium]|nr:DUF1553 domain-containing protein [Acidimicrobiia bacterium]